MAAMAYPVFLLLLWAAMFVGMTVFVLPRFSDMYARFDAQLPALTRFMLDISELLKDHGLLILLFLAASIGALLLLLMKNHRFRERMAALTLKIPVFGRLMLVDNTKHYILLFLTLLQ